MNLHHVSSEVGHQVPIEHHEKPGLQAEMEDPKPTSSKIPTEDSGYQTYKAAGKLQGKKAIITGGDSGIGRAIAILFAMEGASSLITYLPQEEKDAQETKRRVEEIGQSCHCFATDLRDKKNCQAVVDTALKSLGGIDILINNAGTQTMIDDIKNLEEYVFSISFYRVFYVDMLSQVSMGKHVRHQHPPYLLSLKILDPSPEERLYHY